MVQVQERRPASNRTSGSTPRPPDPDSLVARLIAAVTRHRRTLRRLGLAASALIVAVCLAIFARTLLHIDVNRFKAAIAATGGDQIMLAFGFTALSYLALTGYDGLALKHLGIKVPYWLTALASFASYAVSFTLGFPLVTGGAVRYWLYAPAGLTAGKVASSHRRCRRHLLARHGLYRRRRLYICVRRCGGYRSLQPARQSPYRARRDNRVDCLSRLGRQHALAARPDLRQFQAAWAFPHLGADGARSSSDVCSASAALYVLLPKGSGIGYPTFATLYSVAAMLGIASHSPGGLGVFEATILQGVGGNSNAVLASLLLFRGIYYVAPFICAMALLGGVEAMRRWRSIREAMSAPSDD